MSYSLSYHALLWNHYKFQIWIMKIMMQNITKIYDGDEDDDYDEDD